MPGACSHNWRHCVSAGCWSNLAIAFRPPRPADVFWMTSLRSFSPGKHQIPDTVTQTLSAAFKLGLGTVLRAGCKLPRGAGIGQTIGSAEDLHHLLCIGLPIGGQMQGAPRL